jgi:hypothetical protein
MNKYIYIDEHSLSPEICSKIINIYNNSNNKRKGLSANGYNNSIKNTIDFDLLTCDDCYNINILLLNELNNALNHYKMQIENGDYKHFNNRYLKSTSLQFQHYIKNVGNFVYHTDNSIMFDKNEERVLVYMWYLNDVSSGGETDFIDFKIKPTAGKLVIFPSTWTYPHCANIPISNDKYIITGWFVTDIKTKKFVL